MAFTRKTGGMVIILGVGMLLAEFLFKRNVSCTKYYLQAVTEEIRTLFTCSGGVRELESKRARE